MENIDHENVRNREQNRKTIELVERKWRKVKRQEEKWENGEKKIEKVEMESTERK